MSKYKIKKILDKDGLVLISSSDFEEHLWVLTSQRTRKDHICQICGRMVRKAKERMYMPITNKANRMDRICKYCVARS